MIDKNIIIDYIKAQLKKDDIVIQLILINVVLYLIALSINILGIAFGYSFSETMLADLFAKNWLFVPSNFNEFLYKAYTLISYQFLHWNLFHLLSNMFILFYFGRIYIQLTHKKKILPLYVYGGFFAALLFLLAYNTLPFLSAENVVLVGASGSVMAILAAVATLIPEREIALFARFRVKYKWIAIFFLVINLLTLSSPGSAGNYAHVGGLLFGYIFIQLSKNGFDIVSPFNRVFDYIVGFLDFRKKPKVTFVNEKFKNKKVHTPSKPKVDNQEKVNSILDKISQNGYESLTKLEKEFLFKNSKK